MLQEYTMPMEVFIEPLDEDLKCIKLTNKSSELINLGGHKLSCTTEGDHKNIKPNISCLVMLSSKLYRAHCLA